MDMDQAAVFLAGSILTMLGFVVAVAGIVADEALLQQAVNDNDENVRQLALSKLKQLQDNRSSQQ
jgi:hypothetical protein